MSLYFLGSVFIPPRGLRKKWRKLGVGWHPMKGRETWKHTVAGGLVWVDFSLVLRLRGMTRQTSGTAEEAF